MQASVGIHRGWGPARKRNLKTGTAAPGRFGTNGSSVRLDNGAANRQPQPNAGDRCFFAAALELVEDGLRLARWEAGALVLDPELEVFR